MYETKRHFDEGTASVAVIGAAVGAAVVLVAFAVAILLSGADWSLMGVAALAAGFGGTGFGAMLGAVLMSVRVPAPATVPVDSTQ